MVDRLADATRSEQGVGIVSHECSLGKPDIIKVLLAFPNKSNAWYEVHAPIRRGKIAWPQAVIEYRME